jgi:hypothetical protein
VTRRTVVYGDEFIATARKSFPLDRSFAYSGPTFGEFMAGPVLAAKTAFAYDWDNLHAEAGGVARNVITAPNAPFGPFVFYGLLVARIGGNIVEIVSFEGDSYYWERIGDDPDPE